MVRKKTPVEQEEAARQTRNIQVARKAANKPRPVAEDEAPKVRLGARRKGNAARTFWASVMVLILLGLGWFATRAFIQMSSGDVSLPSWLNFGGSKLIGEDKNQVNFLLIGNPGDPTHDGPDLTDTILVASYNPESKALHMFSVPRDFWVDVKGYGGTRINAVYELGAGNERDDAAGAKLLSDTLGTILGIKIPYYMRVDFDGFKQIVDELGGVQMEVKKDLYDPFYPNGNKGYETLDIKAGSYTMGGDMALKYVRSRKTTSDFDRARRQQDVLMALRQKALDLDLLTAPTKMFAIMDILSQHFSTNLSKAEMERLMKLALDFDPNNVTHKVFDDTAEGLLYATRVNEAFVLKPVNDDYSKLSDFVAVALTGTMSETETPTSSEQPAETPLKIEVLNGTNVTGLAGRMADSLKKSGFEIVRAGNNPTRGITASIIYDNTDGKKMSAIRRLAEITGATIATEKLTLPTSVEARLVVGANAETATQQ